MSKVKHTTQQTFLVFQDVFSVTIFGLRRRLEDVLKTSSQDVFKKTSCNYVLKKS